MDVDEYTEMESESIPYTTDWGFTFEDVDIECPNCLKPATKNKYRFNEFENSLDIVTVGICNDCFLVVSGKPMRIYRDGRFSWMEENGTWVVGRIVKNNFLDTLWKRIKSWKIF